jgi:hypothetical protein
MNLSNILSQIEKTGPEVFEKTSGRRSLLKNFGSKLALASVPFAASSFFTKAYRKTSTTSIIDSLNLALQMKFLEYNFYHTANNTGALIPGSSGTTGNDLAGFLAIEAQERMHIIFLTDIIAQLGGSPYTPPNYTPTALNPYFIPSAYDFTAAATYPTVFSNYVTFLTIAQIFEDTGVHAIKGQMSMFLGNATLFTQMMELQSTEGRHAAHVRLIRRLMGTVINPDFPAPWITNNVPPYGTPINEFQAFYTGEDNTIQEGIDITTLPDKYATNGTVPKLSATAAFDESLDFTTIQTLINPFLIL